jgi:porin
VAKILPAAAGTLHVRSGSRIGAGLAGVAAGALLGATAARADPAPAVQLSAVYTAEAWRSTRDGVDHPDAVLGNLELAIQIDSRAWGGDGGTTARLSGFRSDVSPSSDPLDGDLQTVSSKYARPGARIFEAWVRQDLGPGDLKAGRIDLNSEFSVDQTANFFLNGAQGIGVDISQMADHGASLYPNTDLGAVATVRPAGGWTVRAGAFRGRPGPPYGATAGHGGAFVISEASVAAGRARFAVGAWTHTAKFDSLLEPGRRQRASGAYALTEWTVQDGGQRRLDAFARVGLAQPATQEVVAQLTAGLVLSRPFLKTDGEALGLAISLAENGADYRRARRLAGDPVHRIGGGVELSYRYAPAPWLSLQPDIQYVAHNGSVSQPRSALIVGLRTVIALQTH